MLDCERPPAAVLRELINGYQVSQAIHAAAALGLADLLGDLPRGNDDLAAETRTHPASLYRLLRALAAAGVFREHDGRRFTLTPLGECLRSDAKEPMGGWARYIGRPAHWRAWGGLLDGVRTGENAFHLVHGVKVWQARAADPDEQAIFDQAMMNLSRGLVADLLESCDFSRFGTLVDVGGGQGTTLAAVLAAHPRLRGVLFDRPQTVEAARRELDAAGVAGRCRVVGGDFFSSVPPGGDAYLLKGVLQDWDDEQSVRILSQCRRAMSADANLIVVDREIGPPNACLNGKLSDLNMLVSPGGQNRTREEYQALLSAAGFRVLGVRPMPDDRCAITALPQEKEERS
ncbi:methyltransferase [Nonomuraea sp. MG754425]|uniref:methyltransferase n=1 Tax=Nonomuraea sp. MG754425 TaxID=2570319 RepID=UPI001F2D0B0F|nr:methyltransferase [Nonomuraea sp. MG754425]MCF6469993.1 methyltransferase [Nonomuraea sp. MG754425]